MKKRALRDVARSVSCRGTLRGAGVSFADKRPQRDVNAISVGVYHQSTGGRPNDAPCVAVSNVVINTLIRTNATKLVSLCCFLPLCCRSTFEGYSFSFVHECSSVAAQITLNRRVYDTLLTLCATLEGARSNGSLVRLAGDPSNSVACNCSDTLDSEIAADFRNHCGSY